MQFLTICDIMSSYITLKGLLILAQAFGFKNDYNGLSSEKVTENLKLYGYNSDTRLDEKTKGYNPISAFVNLRFVLMLGAAALCFLYPQDIWSIITGIILVILDGVYAGSTIYRHTKCDNYFFELKRRSKTEYNVIRDGEITTVKREHLVPDDIILLSEGESVPADAHLLDIRELTVDESIFSGDKTPVVKITGSDSLSEEFKKSCIYKGSKIVSGELVARVTATGVDTKYFKAFGAPVETDEYYTSIEKLVMRVSNIFTVIAAVMLVVCALLNFTAIDISMDNPVMHTIFHTLYPSITFALCFIPAEIASIVRTYYIRGAKALDERHTSIKNLKTIEHINAVTCILIEKGGTVTKNRMEVADELSANSAMMSNISVLSCKSFNPDIIDQAIILNATFKGVDVKELHDENELIKDYPYNDEIGASGNLWNVNGTRLLCIKGSPERLMPLCDVPSDMLYSVQNKRSNFAGQGYNVLAVAFAQLSEEDEVPESINSIRYSFMGLIALENQTRDYIPAAIRNCYKTGIRVIMMTGDSPETAAAIARKIGIKDELVVTGDELSRDELPDLKYVGVFAGITAQQKPIIIEKLKKSGEIVAISGESASDSDLLELADVGISLARDVSGAAFEACDITMEDNSFENAVEVLRTARQVHSNVKRSISTVLSALIAVIVFGAVNFLLGSEFILTPTIVGLITTLIIPATAYMFMDNSADIKTGLSPSGYIGKGKISKRFFLVPVIQGLGLAISEILFYIISSGYGTDSAAALTPSSTSNFLFIFVFGLLLSAWINITDKHIFSSFKGQATAGIISAVLILSAVAIIFIPFLNTALGLGSVDIVMLILAVVITIVFQIPAELMKIKKR